MEYLIDTPDFERLSNEASERIVKHIAQKGFNDLLRKVAKKGKRAQVLTLALVD